jgi:cytochrome c553
MRRTSNSVQDRFVITSIGNTNSMEVHGDTSARFKRSAIQQLPSPWRSSPPRRLYFVAIANKVVTSTPLPLAQWPSPVDDFNFLYGNRIPCPDSTKLDASVSGATKRQWRGQPLLLSCTSPKRRRQVDEKERVQASHDRARAWSTVAAAAWLAAMGLSAHADELRTRKVGLVVNRCAACHGVDGNGVAEIYPRLAGRYPAYLYKQRTTTQSAWWAYSRRVRDSSNGPSSLGWGMSSKRRVTTTFNLENL